MKIHEILKYKKKFYTLITGKSFGKRGNAGSRRILFTRNKTKERWEFSGAKTSLHVRIYPRPLANRRDREARRINRFRESGQASGEMEDTPEGDKKRKEGKKERGKGVRDKLAPARPNKK